jgi:hypothetical protein
METNPNQIPPAIRGAFDDLESDFDGGSETPRAAVARVVDPTFAQQVTLGTGRTVATLARFPCRKCGGSGTYRGPSQYGSKCFKCKGRGMMKTDPMLAVRRREAKETKRLAEIGAKLAAWAPAHVTELEWIAANCATFDFAASLRDALARYGSLTEGQLGAIRRCIEKTAARAQERAERKPDADVGGAGFARMIAAFDAAKISGLRRPKFRVESYEFAPAKATSQNAGCIYVTARGTYIGKITADGKFFASREATDTHKADVARIGADPLAAAVMHGKQTGNCSCCGRGLENEESVALGIGPVCREKWGLK